MNTHKKAIEILQWSGYLADESGKIMWKKFLWTDVTKKLLLVLQHTKRGLIGITGLQGIGKTTTLHALKNTLEEELGEFFFFVKWTVNWLKNLIDDWDWKRDPDYDELIREAYKTKFNRRYRATHLKRAETKLGKSIVSQVRREVVYLDMVESEYIFIDFPDYSKSSRGMMNADLDSFQDFWQYLQREYKPQTTFVLGIQQEIMEQHNHFFWGKMRLFKLNPLTSDEMIKVYLRFHETYKPFTQEALTQIAKLSQGFFRRFMEYISIVVSQYVIDERQDKITIDDVETLIPSKKVVSDMQVQLLGLFPDDVQRELADQVLELLKQKGTLNQEQIAKILNVTKPRIGRVIQKLDNILVIRTRGKGREWIITLK